MSLSFPSTQACIRKLNTIVPVPPDADLLGDMQNILDAVIAEFQGPVGRGDEGGGTGRSFTPVTETRVFDGSGTSKLVVDDMVSGSSLTVTAYGATLPDVVMEAHGHGLGLNTLTRPLAISGLSGYPAVSGVFPMGQQNIQVTTTWGNAITADIVEAIKAEVCSRALIQGFVGLAGIGETLTLEGYSNNNSAGVSVWRDSSFIAVGHKMFQDCVERYRDSGSWRRTRLATRIA